MDGYIFVHVFVTNLHYRNAILEHHPRIVQCLRLILSLQANKWRKLYAISTTPQSDGH